MKAKLKIDSVEVVKGIIYDDWMVRYSPSGATKSADPNEEQFNRYTSCLCSVQKDVKAYG